MSYPISIQNLIDEFAKLPGIGPRSAARFVFYLLKKPQAELNVFGTAVLNLKKEIGVCSKCFNITDNNSPLGRGKGWVSLCPICQDPKRDQKTICVVEEAFNIPAFEKTGQFNGLYHVLGGVIRPHKGVGPEQLKIKELTERIKNNGITEVIIATNPTTEGETTALYLVRLLKPFKIKITRLARGLPTGGDLEYADELTLGSALAGRREYQ
ncbi:MAG: recombination protein RecR [Nitrospiraceae bacterium]|nr:recombination protein RecR [Nitrospiraceae bacterium]